MKKLITLMVLLAAFNLVNAATYYSKNNSNPGTVGNWSSTRDGSGGAPANFTTSGDIFIVQGTGNGGTTPHSMVTTGTWTLGANVKLQIENGATLTASNAITINATGTFQIDNGGTYIHNNTSTTAIFNGTNTLGATSQVTATAGGSTFIPASLAVNFGNLTINIPSGSTTYQCNGSISSIKNLSVISTGATGNFVLGGGTTYTTSITGDLSVSGGTLTLCNSSSGNGTLSVTGNVTVSGGSFALSNSSGTQNLSVTGNVTVSGGTFNGSGTSSATVSSTSIGGNVIVSAGTYNLTAATANNVSHSIGGDVTISGSGTFGNGTTGGGYTVYITGNLNIQTGGTFIGSAAGNSSRLLNVALGGNLNMTGGTFDCGSGLGSGAFTFRFAGGPANATFTQSGGTFTTSYPGNSNRGTDWTIATGKTVTFNNAFTLPTGRTFKDSGTLATTVAIINNGTFTIGGAAATGTFQLNDGGSVTGTALTYAALGKLSYNGTTIQTTTDIEFPSTNAPNDLIVNNAAGLTLHANKTIAGSLTMTSGKLGLGSNTLTAGSATGSSSSYVNASGAGRLKQTVAASPVLFPIGSASAYNPITLTNAGTSDSYSVGVTSGTPANFTDATYQVQNTWTIAETVDGGSNLTVQTQWATSQEGSSFNRNTNLKVGRYQSGTSWEKYAATLAGSNPYTATASGFATIGTTGVAFSTGNFFVLTSDVALSSPSQVGTGNIGQGTTNNVLFNFQLAASTADAGLTAATFTTAGTYTATDILNFKLWYNSTNTLSGATQVGSAITTSMGTGAHTFSGLSQAVANGTTGYFFITADISFTASASNINVTAIAPGDLTFEAANVTGSTTASGLQTIVSTTVTLASSNPSVPASSISRTVNKNILYKFTLAPVTAGALLNQVDFTTAGTYIAADVSRFQLWYKSSDDFSTAVQIGSDITTSLGTGAHSFTGLSQSISVGATGYLWITTDVPVSATLGNTINIAALTTADITLAAGSKTGTAFAGGTQTIAPASDPTKYFQTKVTGNWSDIATWESSDDNVSWFNATVSPTSAATAITVLGGHIVTVTTGVTVDDLTVAGQLTVISGVTLVINNGAASVDMNVSGKLVNIGTITTTGALSIAATGEYEHAQNGGTIPTATWVTGSTTNVTGTTSTAPGGRGQTFSNFIFDCAGLSTNIVLGNSPSFAVANLMTVKRTGTSTLQLASSSTQETVNVGSYLQSGGSVYIINNYGGTSGGTTRTFNVAGAFTMNNSNGNSLFAISNSTAASTRNFTLNVGGDINIGTGSTLEADLADVPNTNLVLNGTAAQDFTCNGTLGDEIITINKASGVVNLGSNISITNALTMTAGQLSLGNNNITLVSTASRTATVSATAVTTPFTYGTGKFVVQRFVPGGKRAFRFLGHPFSSTLDLTALTDNVLVTGGTGTGGFTPSGTNNPSAFWYNPATGDESPTNDIGWTAFTTTDGSGVGNGWNQYKGIRVLVRGNIADGLSPVTPSAVTIDADGQLNVGTQNIPLTKGTSSGYNFIANPFASSINLTTAGGNVTLGTNVVTNHYVWDISAGTKGAWVNTAFSSSYVLPSFSGFVVKTSANDNITITENAKTTAATTGTLFRNNSTPEMVRLWVKGNNITWDKFELYYNDESKLAEDRHDGVKFVNSEVNFFSIANNKNYSIDSRPFVKGDIIPMGFTSAALQTYTIKATDYSLPANVELYLKDKFLGTETKLEEGAEYTFSITSNTASQGNNRFELVQKQVPTLIPLASMFSFKLSPNPAVEKVQVNFSNEEQLPTTIIVTNILGQSVRTINAGNTLSGQVNVDVRKLAKGTYFVTVNNSKASRTEKLIVQ